MSWYTIDHACWNTTTTGGRKVRDLRQHNIVPDPPGGIPLGSIDCISKSSRGELWAVKRSTIRRVGCPSRSAWLYETS